MCSQTRCWKLSNLFSTNENLSTLPPLVGVELLKVVDRSKRGRVSLFDIFDALRKKRQLAPRSIYFALAFLYSTGIIEFDGVYVWRVQDVED